MYVEIASEDIIHEWLELAREVEPIFQGSMVDNGEFHAFMRSKIEKNEVIIARDSNNPGALMGLIAFSHNNNKISWFAVFAKFRGMGVGSKLLELSLGELDISREIFVTTFREDYEEGKPARCLYQKFGFEDYDTDVFHHGQPRSLMRRMPQGKELMDENINAVINWYSDNKNLDEMRKTTHNPLKIWEKEVASNYFPPDAKILDVGCGMGREAFFLYDMGYTLTGIDISEKAIKMAKEFASRSNRNITFLLANGMDLPFEDNYFDVVIIWAQTLGIIYGENRQLAFLKECKRVLKTNGIISFSGHDREYLELTYSKYLEGNKFFPFEDTSIYWEMFTIEKMKELAQKSELNILNCQRGNIYREEDGTIIHCECRK